MSRAGDILLRELEIARDFGEARGLDDTWVDVSSKFRDDLALGQPLWIGRLKSGSLFMAAPAGTERVSTWERGPLLMRAVSHGGVTYRRFELSQPRFIDAFSRELGEMVWYIIRHVPPEAMDADFIQQLEQLKGMFAPPAGWSVEAVAGLFGEMKILHMLATGHRAYVHTLPAKWRGPFRGYRDFLAKDASLEVKSRIVPVMTPGILRGVRISGLDQIRKEESGTHLLVVIPLKEGGEGQTVMELLEVLVQSGLDRSALKIALAAAGFEEPAPGTPSHDPRLQRFCLHDDAKVGWFFSMRGDLPRVQGAGQGVVSQTVHYIINLDPERALPVDQISPCLAAIATAQPLEE